MPEIAGPGPSQLLIEVEFGVPSRQCVNYGICRIELAQGPGRPKSSGCKQCGGLALAFTPEEGLLELAFLRSSLSEQTQRQHFGKGFFLIEEAFPLPPFLYRKLEMPTAAIACGQYAVLESGPFLNIQFSNLIIF